MIAPLEADERSWTKVYIIPLWLSSIKQAENLSYMRTSREGGMACIDVLRRYGAGWVELGFPQNSEDTAPEQSPEPLREVLLAVFEPPA
jgi:hypothetical protein